MNDRKERISYLDLLFKLFISIYFRLVLIIYGIFLVNINNNYFDWYIYIILIVTYIIIYFKLLGLQKNTFRTLLDFFFICFILYDKNLNEIYNMIYLFFPLLNSPNHTGKKKKLLILIILTLVVIVLISFINKLPFELICEIFLIVFVLSILLYPEFIRNKTNEVIKNIYDDIDDVFSSNTEKIQLNDIFILLIDEINKLFSKSILIKDFKIEIISVFKVCKKTGRVTRRGSNKIIYRYKIATLIKKIKKNKKFISSFDDTISLNNKKYNLNYSLLINEHLFIICFSSTYYKDSILPLFFLRDYIQPIFKKIDKLVLLNTNIKERNHEINQSIQDKYKYINSITRSTHYISNKFNTFNSVIDILKELEKYENKKRLTQSEREIFLELKELLKDESSRAENNLNQIKNYSTNILNNKDNPFNPDTFSDYSVDEVIDLVKDIWLYYHNEKTISFEKDIINVDIVLLKINIETLNVIFTNIIENIRKYSVGFDHISFHIKENYSLSIIMKNKIKDFNKKKEELVKLEKDYKNDERDEINKRSNHGLIEIKELTKILKINSNLSIDIENEMFCIELTIRGKANV